MIVVVGYMARDTLGRRIVEKEKIVRIFGIEYELNAEVVTINAMSGHADQRELLEFATACLPLKKVFLVHGEEDQTKALLDILSLKGISAHAPVKNEEVLLD